MSYLSPERVIELKEEKLIYESILRSTSIPDELRAEVLWKHFHLCLILGFEAKTRVRQFTHIVETGETIEH